MPDPLDLAADYDDDGQRWGLFERKVVGPDDDPMLVRYRLLRTPWFGVFIHKLLRDDRSRDPHDHPWPFVGVVLVGGYIELLYLQRFPAPDDPDPTQRVCVRAVTRRRFSAGYRPATGTWHRFSHLLRLPTWTLVLVGRKCNRWGFLLADGTFVAAREYQPETYRP